MEDTVVVATVSIEGVVTCFEFTPAKRQLTRAFNAQDHVGRVRAMTVSAKGLICTGGDDDNLRFYDAVRRQCLQTIVGYNSAVRRLFTTQKYLICGHEGGKVTITGLRDMNVYHTLGVFKHKLIDADLHDSGRLLACLSETGRFAVWSLTDCAVVFHRKAARPPERVKFLGSTDLLLQFKSSLVVFSLSEMKATRQVSLGEEEAITCWTTHALKEKVLLVLGCESGKVVVYDATLGLSDNSLATFTAHESRVKGVKAVGDILVTICTDGEMSIWDCSAVLTCEEESKVNCVEKVKLDSRLVLLEACGVQKSQSKSDSATKSPVPRKVAGKRPKVN